MRAGVLQIRLLDPGQRPAASDLLQRAFGPASLGTDHASLSVSCPDGDRGAAALATLSGQGIGIADFSLGQPSLDEVFLALTGHRAEPLISGDDAPEIVEEGQSV